ncbi:DUF2742 domain-containing protein [Mycolicibacterium monacense]|uniref:DUF2742 domain-containing protein n=1 Tax=Mycolicibacterium monacense TaxID=85693 RepID=UPI001F2A591E|nr:DUF2742 domain-containing protein [Mycolicibacterium monacense]
MFLEAVLAQANTGSLPMAGTPAWGALADSDPRKLLALAAAGEHHALRMETAQAARAEANQEISTAAPWSQIAHQQLQRAQWDEAHPWARPTASRRAS